MTCPQVKFEFIISPLDNLYLLVESMDHLSDDQQLLLEYAVGISWGQMNLKFASWKIEQMNQAND